MWVRRLLIGTAGLAATCAAYGLWLITPEAPLQARFAPGDCRQVALSDPRTGRAVIGVEDMALAPDGTLILSAHDRLDPAWPDGGVYGLRLRGPAAGAALRRLDAPRSGVFRPHGIALDPEMRRLAVINRVGVGAARVEIGWLGPNGWDPDQLVEDRRLCRANDLTFRGRVVVATLDRADCGVSLRDLSPWAATGALARLGPAGLTFETTGLRFPNGIDGQAVAESRAGAIRLGPGAGLMVPGAPDNLTRDHEGALIAALHPSLLRLFLMRQGVLRRAGSRIVRIEGQVIEMLFDDPRGQVISGATVGMLADGRLLIGSATAPGLVVCEKGR